VSLSLFLEDEKVWAPTVSTFRFLQTDHLGPDTIVAIGKQSNLCKLEIMSNERLISGYDTIFEVNCE
jgi:hypothetical protein